MPRFTVTVANVGNVVFIVLVGVPAAAVTGASCPVSELAASGVDTRRSEREGYMPWSRRSRTAQSRLPTMQMSG